MTAWEFWTCDWCNQDHHSREPLYEDLADDEGWIQVDKHVMKDNGSGALWSSHVDEHFCGECLTDPELLEYIYREQFRPVYGRDEDRLNAARAAL
jgi:hypothetical protein